MINLSRWLRRGAAVLAHALLRWSTESEPGSDAPASTTLPPTVDGQPPAEWVALVRDRAPQLLEPVAHGDQFGAAETAPLITPAPRLPGVRAHSPGSSTASPRPRIRGVETVPSSQLTPGDAARAIDADPVTRSPDRRVPLRLSVRRPSTGERDAPAESHAPDEIGVVVEARQTAQTEPVMAGPSIEPSSFTNPAVANSQASDNRRLARLVNQRVARATRRRQFGRVGSAAPARSEVSSNKLSSPRPTWHLTARARRAMTTTTESVATPASAPAPRRWVDRASLLGTLPLSAVGFVDDAPSPNTEPDLAVVSSPQARPNQRPRQTSRHETQAATEEIMPVPQPRVKPAQLELVQPNWAPLPSSVSTAAVRTSFTERRRKEHEAI